jgi:hypothetical protein
VKSSVDKRSGFLFQKVRGHSAGAFCLLGTNSKTVPRWSPRAGLTAPVQWYRFHSAARSSADQLV